MILVIAPAIDGLRREWREAASNLGASSGQYWWYVGLPILAPSLLGAAVLLFAHAFAAHATPHALTAGPGNIVTVVIPRSFLGDVLAHPNQGYALGLGLVVGIAGSTLI